MQSEFPGVRRVVGALAFVFLSACSGGGDGDSSRHIGLSATSLTFSAAAPNAETPASQVITATFGEGVANIAALHTGPAIERVDVALNGTSAQITVVPAAPPTLGAGAFKGTIAITGYFCGDPSCSRLEAGQTQTVNAGYQISPVVTEVIPKAATAGMSANVIIRGAGFQGFSVQGVSFGTTAATTISIPSDTEIRATYPALAAGSYPVTLDIPTHVGPVPTTATLVVVEPIAPVAQALAWPGGAVGNVHALEFDVLRSSLLAATDSGSGQLVRYAYTGGAWQAPTTASLANLRDAALSTDAAQFIAISTTHVVPVDPATLALGTGVPVEVPENSFLKSLALLNTHHALITTGFADSTATPVFAYTVSTGAVTELETKLNNATARGSANGALIALMQGDPTVTTDPTFYVASASGAIAPTTIALNQNAIPPVIDRDATRLVLNGRRVYDSMSVLLGTLPETTAAVTLAPDGKRAYTFDTAANGVLVFDISESKSGEAYAALGAPVALAAAPGSGLKMTISADGKALFIAGTAQLVVQPTPAL